MSADPSSHPKKDGEGEASVSRLPSIYETSELRFLQLPSHLEEELELRRQQASSSTQEGEEEEEDWSLLQRSLDLSHFLSLQHPRFVDWQASEMQRFFTQTLRSQFRSNPAHAYLFLPPHAFLLVFFFISHSCIFVGVFGIGRGNAGEGITLDHLLIPSAGARTRDKVYLGFHGPELARRAEAVLSRTSFSTGRSAQDPSDAAGKVSTEPSLQTQAAAVEETKGEEDLEFRPSVSTVLDLHDGSKRTRQLLRSDLFQRLDLLGAAGKGEKLRRQPRRARKLSRSVAGSALLDWLAEVENGERRQSLETEDSIFMTRSALRPSPPVQDARQRKGSPVPTEAEIELRRLLDIGRRKTTESEVRVGAELAQGERDKDRRGPDGDHTVQKSGRKGQKSPRLASWWSPDPESRAAILEQLDESVLDQLRPAGVRGKTLPIRAEEWGLHCVFIQPGKALPSGVISHALCRSPEVLLIPLGSHLPLSIAPLTVSEAPVAVGTPTPPSTVGEILLHPNSSLRLSGRYRFQHTISVSPRTRDTIADRQVWKRHPCSLLSVWWKGPTPPEEQVQQQQQQQEEKEDSQCLCGASSRHPERGETQEKEMEETKRKGSDEEGRTASGSLDTALTQPPAALCDRVYPLLQQKLHFGIILSLSALQEPREGRGRKGKGKKKGSRQIVAEAVPPEKLRNPEQLEQEHVQDVYEAIADHFSHTRYGTWPRVSEFLKGLPAGTRVADVACGNGKYWWVNRDLKMKGCDLSQGLVDICRARGLDVVVADALDLPWEDESFDVSICVALLHHISSKERRLQVLRELLRIVRPGGQILVTAWALEQDPESRRKFESSDVFVSWNLPPQIIQARRERERQQREEESAVREDTGGVDAGEAKEEPIPDQPQTFRRYCHVYREGELDELFMELGGCIIESSVWDKGNWCLIVRKQENPNNPQSELE